jgi:hypothetical protein
MRQIDLGLLQSIIEYTLDNSTWYLESYIDDERIINVVANIFLNNDVAIEVSTRIPPLTIIATHNRISVIIDEGEGTQKRSTYYKSDHDLCHYESIEDDVENILTTIDVCLIRLQG